MYVSPHRVKGADRGLVVVGGSVEMGDLEAAEAGLQAGDSTLEGKHHGRSSVSLNHEIGL